MSVCERDTTLMCASAKYRLSRDGVLWTPEIRDSSGVMGVCFSVCVDAGMQITQV